MTTTPMIGTVRSGWGKRRALIPGMSTFHRGVDLSAPRGTSVCSPEAGVVVVAAYNPARGHHVIVDHGQFQTVQQHLGRRDVAKGQHVGEGQHLGPEGMSGVATGVHLHTEVWDRGTPVDPSPWYLARGVILGTAVRIAGGRIVAENGDAMFGLVVIAKGLPYALYTGGGHYQELPSARWAVVGNLLRKTPGEPGSVAAIEVIDLTGDKDGGKARYAELHAALAHHGPSW